MSERFILITAPSLDTKYNVSGISSLTGFIIHRNSAKAYQHFELGRKDEEKRNAGWLFRMMVKTVKWMVVVSSRKISLVHFNFALSKPSILRDTPLVLFAKLIRKKMVIHIHGGDYLTNTKAPRWMRFLLKSVFAGSNQVIVLSPVEQVALSETYKIKNIKVLPNCIDTREAMAFNRSFEKPGELKMLFIGRITTSKGIAYIYQALSNLKKRMPALPLKFSMAGTGPDEKEYVEKFSALLGTDFEFKGIVSGPAKTALYKNCQIFLLPSLFEGLPMSLLESMSFGLVPVVTSVGSIKHVVQHGQNGILVDDNPAEDTALAVEKLYTDHALLQELGSNARNFIFKHYNPDEYIMALNKIYAAA
jgi:glycosyltransferase involved in cell wall biosynthesis